MSELWEDIRAAIVTKADAVAGLRDATAGRPERRGGFPRVEVGIPSLSDVDRLGAHQEDYTLEYPADLLIGRPAGVQRAEEDAADLMRLIQVAFRTGEKLGLPNQVQSAWISDARPTLDSDDDDALIGYGFTVTVRVMETLATGRTA